MFPGVSLAGLASFLNLAQTSDLLFGPAPFESEDLNRAKPFQI